MRVPLFSTPASRTICLCRVASAACSGVENEGYNKSAEVSTYFGPSCGTCIPVETQYFGENENEHHADKDSRLAHERAYTLPMLAHALALLPRLDLQRLLQSQWRTLQPDPTDRPTDRPPCA